MRSAVRSVLVVLGIAATVVGSSTDVRLASVSMPHGDFAITSVLPMRGELVGVAHPVVVTFSRPIAQIGPRPRTRSR